MNGMGYIGTESKFVGHMINFMNDTNFTLISKKPHSIMELKSNHMLIYGYNKLLKGVLMLDKG